MLDADASFRPDPEVPAPLLPDPAALPLRIETAPAPLPPAPQDSLPTECLPVTAPPALSAAATPGETAADTDHPASPDDGQEDGTADPRPVTPRRLLRLSSARTTEDAPVHALPVLNLFDGIFDEDETLSDPRLMRSRARARRLLAAHEAGLSEAERNLWHDDPQPEPAPAAAITGPEPHGRRIRHLTAADIAPHSAERATDPVNDPLRDRLHAARDALYTVHPDDPQPLPQQGLAARLGLQATTALLLVLAWPAGLLLAAASVLRGGDLRLTARTVAITGTATALLKVAPFLLT